MKKICYWTLKLGVLITNRIYYKKIQSATVPWVVASIMIPMATLIGLEMENAKA